MPQPKERGAIWSPKELEWHQRRLPKGVENDIRVGGQGFDHLLADNVGCLDKRMGDWITRIDRGNVVSRIDKN